MTRCMRIYTGVAVVFNTSGVFNFFTDRAKSCCRVTWKRRTKIRQRKQIYETMKGF